MILSDFLSRQRVDRSNPHEIIPISFDMRAILNDKYYNWGKENRYLVQTWSQSKDRNKSTRSTWSRKRYRSKFKTRMDSEKNPEISSKI